MKKNQNRKIKKELSYTASNLWEQVRRKQSKTLGKTQPNGREKINIAQGNAGGKKHFIQRRVITGVAWNKQKTFLSLEMRANSNGRYESNE